jgi:vacuolar-type H+-ATPase subunit E/Vma4
VLTCAPGLAESLASLAASHGALRIETDEAMAAGFRVTAADGALVVDGTLESLLELERDVLAIEVLRRLDGGSDS